MNAPTMTLYRVQDGLGRSPLAYVEQWAEGDRVRHWPAQWARAWRPLFGGADVLTSCDGWISCGFRTVEAAAGWFTEGERVRLYGLGFGLVAIAGCEPIASLGDQVIYRRLRPPCGGVEGVAW